MSMSDWMSGPHRAQRPVDLEVTPDPDPVELTDPVDVIAWLRALPLGAILLDSHEPPRVWQVRTSYATLAEGQFTVMVMGGSEEQYELGDAEDAGMVADEGPFRVLWVPPGGAR